MITIIHKKCGEPAMYAWRKFELGDIIAATNLWHLDGSRAIKGEVVRCGSCGESFCMSPSTVDQK